MKTSKKKTPKKATTGEYRNLELANGLWSFEVKVGAGWVYLSGLSGETSMDDAKAFAQKTADAWRKK